MGADTGGGKASLDWCAATVLAVDNGEQMASWRAHVEARDFAQSLMMLGTFYGGRRGQAFLCCEANNHGLATLEVLRLLGYWNLYTKQDWDSIERKFLPKIGFNTNVKSRPMLISRMRGVLSDPSIAIRDEVVLEEATTFVFDENGKEDHVDGANDDALFAYMLATEARTMAIETNPIEEVKPVEENRDAWVWEKARKDLAEASFRREVEYDEGDRW